MAVMAVLLKAISRDTIRAAATLVTAVAVAMLSKEECPKATANNRAVNPEVTPMPRE